MRIISKSRNHFHGRHKGCDVQIEREKPVGDPDVWGGKFYIIVTGGDGWSPARVNTMAEAKREAIRGAGL